MNKPGRIGFFMAFLAPFFAAIVAVAVHFKSTVLFLFGWVGVALCVLVGVIAVFSAIILQLRSSGRHSC